MKRTFEIELLDDQNYITEEDLLECLTSPSCYYRPGVVAVVEITEDRACSSDENEDS